jgi:hypothetical protein
MAEGALLSSDQTARFDPIGPDGCDVVMHQP